MLITKDYFAPEGYYEYLIEDDTGLYAVELRTQAKVNIYRTFLLDPESKKPLIDTGDTQNWDEFYKRGWTKLELHRGHREVWNLPKGYLYKD